MDYTVFKIFVFFSIAIALLDGVPNDFCYANLTKLGGTPDGIDVPPDSTVAVSQDSQVIAMCSADTILLKCNETRSFTFGEGELESANVSCTSDHKLFRQKGDGGTEELKVMPPCLGPCQGGITCLFKFLNSTPSFETDPTTTAVNLENEYNPSMRGCEKDMVVLRCPNEGENIHFNFDDGKTWLTEVDSTLNVFQATCVGGVFTAQSPTIPALLNSTQYQPMCLVPAPSCAEGVPCLFKFLNSSATFLTDASTNADNIKDEENPVMFGCEGEIVSLSCAEKDMTIHLSFTNLNGTYHEELDTGVNVLESTCTSGNYTTSSTVVPDLYGFHNYTPMCMVPVTTTSTEMTSTSTTVTSTESSTAAPSTVTESLTTAPSTSSESSTTTTVSTSTETTSEATDTTSATETTTTSATADITVAETNATTSSLSTTSTGDSTTPIDDNSTTDTTASTLPGNGSETTTTSGAKEGAENGGDSTTTTAESGSDGSTTSENGTSADSDDRLTTIWCKFHGRNPATFFSTT